MEIAFALGSLADIHKFIWNDIEKKIDIQYVNVSHNYLVAWNRCS
jgi:hypothetical protein